MTSHYRANSTRVRDRHRLLRAALVFALAVAACGDDDDGRDRASPGPSPTTSSTSPPTTTTSVPRASEEAVIAAYQEFSRVFDTYGAQNVPFDPAEFKATVGPVATGGEYEHLFDLFQTNRAQGHVFQGGESDVLRPKVTELTPERAVVEDCADDSGGVFDTRNNRFVDEPTPGKTIFITAVLVIEDGRWKVTSLAGPDESCTP